DDDNQRAIRKPQTEAEEADAKKIESSTDIVKDKLGLEAPKMVPPPEGKPLLTQSPSDALIGLPMDVIPATASAADALAQFQKQGIPRWGALTEKERQHETKF